MPDADFSIDRSRRRETPDESDAIVSAGAPPDDRAARVARDAAAATKLARWIRDASDTCTSFGNPFHDFDRCVVDPDPRPRGAAPRTPSLYVREAEDQTDIAPSDVAQGKLGDCHLLAPLAAFARTDGGRALIHDAITEQRNDHGDVVGYSVRLYQAEWHLTGPKTFTEKHFDVPANGPYVVGHARAAGDVTRDEIWPLVMENAYAQLRGGYDAIGFGGSVRAAMEALTGREVRHADMGDVSDELLWSDLDAQKAVVLSSKHDIGDNPLKITEKHAYFVVAREDHDGDVLYRLRNPWDDDERRDVVVPYAQLAKYFDAVDVTDRIAR